MKNQDERLREEDLVESLRTMARKDADPQDDAIDLVRRTVSYGHATVPIANLRALLIISKVCGNMSSDDPATLLTILWILQHQNEERVLDVLEQPVDIGDLADLAAAISLFDLPDYIAALDKMFGLARGKAPVNREGGCA